MIEETNEALESALSYAARGFRVLPLHTMLPDGRCDCRRDGCDKPAKHPRVSDWQNGASSVADQIRRWWGMWPTAGVAILTGEQPDGSELIVLDIDSHKFGDDSLDTLMSEFGPLPDTLCALSGGGGRHFYFVHVEPVRKRIGVRPGVDIIAGGSTGRGYVVAPPSTHASGRRYAWELSSPDRPATAPAWLIALANEGKGRSPRVASGGTGRGAASASRYVASALARACDAIRGAVEGTRNDTLNREGYSIGGLVGSGSLDHGEARAALEGAARDAGLFDNEITRTLDSALRAGEAAPREVPTPTVGGELEAEAPYSEIVSADYFVRECGADLAYAPERGWLSWAGTHWTPDELHPSRLAQAFARKRATAALSNGADHRTVLGVLKGSTVRAIIELSRAQLAIPQSAFDADPWLFNCASGTIDLRTGELRSHRREDRCTKIAAVTFDPNAMAPTWETFLRRVQPDDDVREFLQRLAGHAMLGEVREHVLPVLYGRGANGKSTFLEALQFAFGAYASAVPSSVLMQRDGEPHPTEQAQLLGLRLAVASETKQGRKLDEGTVKSLTGGDRIKARFMHRDFFEFPPSHSIFLATNHRPKVQGTDEGIWRRLLLVPWAVTVPEAERDKELGSKLRAEAPGILRWCLDGFRAWQARGLAAPQSVCAATAEYRAESDALGRFLDERCERSPHAKIQSGALYQAFERWCRESDETAMTQTAFGRALSDDHGLEKRKSGAVYWIGLGLRQQGGRHDDERDEPQGGLGGLEGLDKSPHAHAREATSPKPSKPSQPSQVAAAPTPVLPLGVSFEPPRLASGDRETHRAPPWQRNGGTR